MGDAFDVDLAASTLQANSTDVRILLRVLAGQLGGVLGSRLTVERAGGLLRRSGEMKAVQAQMGDDVFRAEIDGPSVHCTVARTSGGIRIRNEQVGMDEWLKRLLGALHAEAAHSDVARRTLEQFMTGGPSL